ncbi:hypothetical protein Y1Q_0019809 [Alligator mississippiensis]|uniref:Uncharacterized protein n=1 Tax=Alligator mississippiensis TaxID=8496 RepID=A0A151PF64_ALLMI|nr:hypothetical protein Y1Q_0019809 [Alligator mississippiensis]
MAEPYSYEVAQISIFICSITIHLYLSSTHFKSENCLQLINLGRVVRKECSCVFTVPEGRCFASQRSFFPQILTESTTFTRAEKDSAQTGFGRYQEEKNY